MEMILPLLGVLCFAATLSVDVATDLRLFGTGLILHWRGLLLRIPGLSLASGCVGRFDLSDSTLAALVLCAVYWLLFDYCLNIGKGFYWLRIGQTATIDRLLQLLSPAGAFALKLSVLAGTFLAVYFLS